MAVENLNLFDIDITRLDDECLNHPKIFYVNSKKLADARTEVQQCEAELELLKDERKETEARLRLKIQNNPTQYKIKDKPTVAAVDAAILCCKAYKDVKEKHYKAQQELNNAWNTVNHLKSLVDALQDKKDMIEYLVKLHGQQYFSEPKVRRETGEKVVEAAKSKRANTKVKKRKVKN